MSFEEEWSGLKQAAVERRTAMRLNQLASAGGGGGAPDLKSATEKKRKAANAIENKMERGTREAGDLVDEPTEAAVRAFAGWDTAVGLKESHEKWEDQVRSLLGRLTRHKGQLRSTATILESTDVGVRHTIQRPQSKISEL
ncbi:hypothetical protein M4914_08090 [Streptomyces somaliensis DSM 40738]|uniref:Uncharacterized protein n=1 Tax=Streptomyces somaliensis (strain ATCC 33201 / DSM 40738 / JCM 12659 / KCTC 9044 / NCTC 11332 / NRRL B-12077 / IP 733) TaxID=1134445 RepID=A0AA44DCY2_STRE0|nr:hypothetical protein [Streptomyces somaliensis]MCQ0022917.1 hypothetical protein [Streptomyces somaliensis DSM 40738]NKY14163.1 hypothetical protein [Streptomyces somaliensis DSM 40738]